MLLVLAFAACSTPEATKPAEPPPATTPTTTTASSTPSTASHAVARPWDGVRVEEGTPAPGWGAVFWATDGAWQVGGGNYAVGRMQMGMLLPRATQIPTVCGGKAVSAPDKAMIVLPQGTAVPTAPEKPTAIDAHLVETVGRRMEELLPPPDDYTPRFRVQGTTATGVSLGSIVRMRRHAAPPVLVTTGTRDCTTVVAILDEAALQVHSWIQWDDVCSPPGLISPTDLDGDGSLETGASNGTSVAAIRIEDQAAKLKLVELGRWSCPDALAHVRTAPVMPTIGLKP